MQEKKEGDGLDGEEEKGNFETFKIRFLYNTFQNNFNQICKLDV